MMIEVVWFKKKNEHLEGDFLLIFAKIIAFSDIYFSKKKVPLRILQEFQK